MVQARNTPQRQLVLELLRASDRHPTAEELWAWAREEMPTISRGTVYRNLEHLVTAGAVLRLEGGDGPARYDGRCDHHDHLRCHACGIMVDVEPADLAGHGRALQARTGFRIDRRELVFAGLCPDCQSAAPATSSPTSIGSA